MDNYKFPFNKPFIHGRELMYIAESVASGKISGDGVFTSKCQNLLEQKFGFGQTRLTTSCTDALEIAALALNIMPGDEIILPSFTFVSTANAFALRGAKLVFIDSEATSPNIDADLIEKKITRRTRAIVIVHYAGVACNMEKIIGISEKYQIPVIEDAAQAIGAKFKDRYLGTFGAVSTFSFHETKNISCGEGGAIVVNDNSLVRTIEIIREKGTNRSSFLKGDVDKYTWINLGSSFLPSDLLAAYLFAQLENIDQIQEKRIRLWETYESLLSPFAQEFNFFTPYISQYGSNNAHMYYLVLENAQRRSALIKKLQSEKILAVSHYIPLHSSPFMKSVAHHHLNDADFPNCNRYGECLMRLPMYYELDESDARFIASKIISSMISMRNE
jgi:dTDP-4-amino-4,6-dideoxygalactose transaminase